MLMVTAPLVSAPWENRETSKSTRVSMPAPLLLPPVETDGEYPDWEAVVAGVSPSSKYFDDVHPGLLRRIGHVEAQPIVVPLSAMLAPCDGFNGPFSTDATAPTIPMEAIAAAPTAFHDHQVFSVVPAGFVAQPGWGMHSPVDWNGAACLPMKEMKEKLDTTHGGYNLPQGATVEQGAVDSPTKDVPVAVFVDLSGLREKLTGGSPAAIGQCAWEKRGPRSAVCAAASWGGPGRTGRRHRRR